MKKNRTSESEINRGEAEELTKEFKSRDKKSHDLFLDLGAALTLHTRKGNLGMEDYLFALAKVPTTFIEQMGKAAMSSEVKKYGREVFLRYFSMNLTDIKVREKLRKQEEDIDLEYS